jgi:spindle assembly abnormal protein 6
LESNLAFQASVKSSLEDSVRELTSRIKELGSENLSLQSSIQTHSSTRRVSSDKSSADVEQEASQLRDSLLNYEKERLEREERISNLKNDLKSSRDVYLKAEETTHFLRNQNADLETCLAKSQAEVRKANDIILKLQNEIRATKSKYKGRLVGLEGHEKESAALSHELALRHRETQLAKEELVEKNKLLEASEKRQQALVNELKEAKETCDKSDKSKTE